MDPERTCLESPFVEKLTIETSSGEIQEVPQCFLLSRLIQPDLEPENQALLKSLLGRLNDLEVGLVLLPDGWKPIELQMSVFQPFVFKAEYGQLIVGGEFLRSEGLLEKAIVQEVLQTKFATPDRYALEVVSDFLTSVILNHWVLGEVEASGSFLSHVVSFQEYCYSDLKSIFHWDYCINQNSLLDVADGTPGLKDVTIWGLRKFLGEKMWRLYQKAPVDEKSEFLLTVIKSLNVESFQYPTEVDSIAALAEWSDDYLKQLTHKESTKSDFLRVPMVLDFRDVSGEPLGSIPSPDEPLMKKHAINEIFIQHQGGVTHLPSFRKLTINMSEVVAEYLILPTCRDYTFAELAEFHAEKVVVIEGCEKVEWNWPELLNRKLMSYLSGSKKKFAVFHVNSLKFAIQQGSVKSKDTFRLIDVDRLKKRYAWQSLFWSKQFLAYVPKSDINMITLIR